MKRFPAPWKFGGIVLLFIIGIVFRVLALPAVSTDMQWGLFQWYDFLEVHGAQGLGIQFATYSPPYLYLLWFATLTSGFLPKLLAIKLISIIADIINMFLIYRIVRLKYQAGLMPLLASALFWSMPTVILNSSLWGEADSIYTTLLLACLYFLMSDQPLLGVCFFGAAFTVKAQAFFIFPVLILLALKKRIAWYYFLVIPLIYGILCLPAILLGQSWFDVFTIYLFQSSVYHDVSRNAPNLYIFMNSFPYVITTITGLILAAVLTLGWIWNNMRAKLDINRNTIVLMGLVSVALVPFVLPKMHDRYFYPADVFSLLAAFYMPELWFVPILYQVISTLAYMVFLFNVPVVATEIAAVLNTLTVIFLVWKQSRTLIPTSQPLSKESLA